MNWLINVVIFVVGVIIGKISSRKFHVFHTWVETQHKRVKRTYIHIDTTAVRVRGFTVPIQRKCSVCDVVEYNLFQTPLDLNSDSTNNWQRCSFETAKNYYKESYKVDINRIEGNQKL